MSLITNFKCKLVINPCYEADARNVLFCTKTKLKTSASVSTIEWNTSATRTKIFSNKLVLIVELLYMGESIQEWTK